MAPGCTACFCYMFIMFADSTYQVLKTQEAAPFLAASQKRDILYNNAARFLNFSKEEIKKHHQQ